MPIDPLTERVLPLKDLGRKLPGKPQYTTVVAWCQQGRVNWYTHQRVKMEMLYLPGGRASSFEAYLRFVAALNVGARGA